MVRKKMYKSFSFRLLWLWISSILFIKNRSENKTSVFETILLVFIYRHTFATFNTQSVFSKINTYEYRIARAIIKVCHPQQADYIRYQGLYKNISTGRKQAYSHCLVESEHLSRASKPRWSERWTKPSFHAQRI